MTLSRTTFRQSNLIDPIFRGCLRRRKPTRRDDSARGFVWSWFASRPVSTCAPLTLSRSRCWKSKLQPGPVMNFRICLSHTCGRTHKLPERQPYNSRLFSNLLRRKQLRGFFVLVDSIQAWSTSPVSYPPSRLDAEQV